MSPDAVLSTLTAVADAVGRAIAGVTDWSLSGARDGQYRADVVADEVAVAMLRAAGFGIVSEESGSENLDREIVVIVDPLDGSTNASRGLPHFATSLCALDRRGPLAAVVAHQAQPVRWTATRGAGAHRNGVALPPRQGPAWRDAVVAVSGRPPDDLDCWQFRSLGASAIDLCLVADGTLDAFIDMSPSAHGVWDYAGAWLVCREVGVEVFDAEGRDLLVLDHGARRTPIAAPPELVADCRRVRNRA